MAVQMFGRAITGLAELVGWRARYPPPLASTYVSCRDSDNISRPQHSSSSGTSNATTSSDTRIELKPTLDDTANETSTSSPEPASVFPFLSLPPELRNIVYDLSGHLEIYQCRRCTAACYKYDRWEWVLAPSWRKKDARCWVHVMCCSVGRAPLEDVPRAMDAKIQVNDSSKYPVNHGRFLGCSPLHSDEEHRVTVAQPEITKVSKMFRQDTLPMFYGGRQFYFTCFEDVKDEAATLLRWLKTIGPSNAALLHDLAIVYSRKQDVKYLNKKLMPQLRKAGVRVDANVVKLVRLLHPFCRCGRCVLASLIEADPVVDEEAEKGEDKEQEQEDGSSAEEWPEDVF